MEGSTNYDNYTGYQHGGTMRLTDGASVSSHTVVSGTLALASGGTATSTTIANGGYQLVSANATVTRTTITSGGSQIVASSGTATDTMVSSGASQEVKDGGFVSGVTINEGAIQTVGEKGTVENVTVYGTQSVGFGGTVTGMTIAGGTQTIGSGGQAISTTITDGLQNVAAGGTASHTTINGGQQILAKGTADNPGGVSEHITINGGTLTVNDYATAKIDKATGGMLELLDTGLAEAWLVGGTSFTFDNAFARGDTVRLGTDNSTIGKSLVITNMDGYANFYINTDLANNTADTITMTSVVNATSANKIYINYDPTLAQGTAVTTSDTTVANVGTANTATFEGAESTIGGYSFTPTVASTDNGLTWKITGVTLNGNSEQMYDVLGNASSKAAYWRQAGAPVINRMAQLRRNPSVGNDFWVNFTRGKNSLDNQGHDVSATYSRMDIGFDRRANANWTVGASYGLKYGSEGYSCGSGDSHDDILTAYGLWQGNGGRYSEITLRAGRLASHLDLQDPGQAALSKGDNSTYGQAISFTYGQRMEKPDGWYMEPHVGFQWAHVNGYSYSLSDGSNVSVDDSNSFIGNLGINVGKEFSKGSTFYARADLMHDFAGGVRTTMTKGMANSLENDFRDTWLDLALGFKRQSGPVEWYIEAGRLGIGSKAAQGNWVVNCGLSYSF